MKKILFAFLSLFLLVARPIHSQTVYITDTGEKYHTESCWTLSKSKIAVDMNEALNKGYEACKICKPVQLISANTQGKQEIKAQKAKSEQSSSSQCSATTKAGARCKRVTASGNGKCWQHGGN